MRMARTQKRYDSVIDVFLSSITDKLSPFLSWQVPVSFEFYDPQRSDYEEIATLVGALFGSGYAAPYFDPENEEHNASWSVEALTSGKGSAEGKEHKKKKKKAEKGSDSGGANTDTHNASVCAGFVAEHIVRQPTVGTVVKIPHEDQEVVTEEDGAINGHVVGVISVIPLSLSFPSVVALREWLLPKIPEVWKQRFLGGFGSTALVTMSVFVNVPMGVFPFLMDALGDEITWAIEDEPTEARRKLFGLQWLLVLIPIGRWDDILEANDNDDDSNGNNDGAADAAADFQGKRKKSKKNKKKKQDPPGNDTQWVHFTALDRNLADAAEDTHIFKVNSSLQGEQGGLHHQTSYRQLLWMRREQWDTIRSGWKRE